MKEYVKQIFKNYTYLENVISKISKYKNNFIIYKIYLIKYSIGQC